MMAHTHQHVGSAGYGNAFVIGIALNIFFVAVEVVFGIAANSSALLADAGHNAGDVLSLVFAWAAAWLATLRPKGIYTYGLRKTTILVSILNALMLFAAVTAIAWDAVDKLKNPQPVSGTQVMIVAAAGILVNSITALLFFKRRSNDLNIKGAFLHMAADAAVSAGVLVAGLLIKLTGKLWIDPAASFAIIAIILWGTWNLFTDAVDLALDAVPKHINLQDVREFLLSRENVEDIHDLHVWAMSTNQVALTAHLVMPLGYDDNFLYILQEQIRDTFGICHTTFQIETKSIEEVCNPGC
jgi:cobalt-zinc-cadmium efflux system protein